jgi:glycosyltransferase involved in cell wall biosynthesis
MRVLILLDAFSLGGAEKQALLFADWLQNVKGEVVEIWAFMPGDGSAKIVCDRYKLKTRVIGYFRGLARYIYPKQIWDYSRLFNEFKPDVLMGYTSHPNFLLGLVWKHTTAKTFIWGVQSSNYKSFNELNNTEKKAILNTPYFVSNSENATEFFSKNYSVPSSKLSVIYNGPEAIKSIFTRDEWRKKIGIDSNDFVAVMLAHIAKRKDHQTAVQAWKIVVETLLPKGINPILIFGGIFGDSTDTLFQQIIASDLYANVKFLGNVQDVAGINLASDLHVLSSNTEGVPNSLLEAMSLGLPVVGTNIPGIREALGDENEPFLSKPKNPDDLAKIIIGLALDKKLRNEVSEKNVMRVKSIFNLNEMCERHYDLMIKEVLK